MNNPFLIQSWILEHVRLDRVVNEQPKSKGKCLHKSL